MEVVFVCVPFPGRKLAAHDKWSKLAVYVAMDMLVVIEDMSKQPIIEAL